MKPDKRHICLDIIQTRIEKGKSILQKKSTEDDLELQKCIQIINQDNNHFIQISSILEKIILAENRLDFQIGVLKETFFQYIENSFHKNGCLSKSEKKKNSKTKSSSILSNSKKKSRESIDSELTMLEIQMRRLSAKLTETKQNLISEFVDYSYYILASENDDIEVTVYEKLVCLLKNIQVATPEIVEITMRNYNFLIDEMTKFKPENYSTEFALSIEGEIKEYYELINPDYPSSNKISEVYRHLFPVTQWIMIATELIKKKNSYKEGLSKMNVKKPNGEAKNILKNKEDQLSEISANINELDNYVTKGIEAKIDVEISKIVKNNAKYIEYLNNITNIELNDRFKNFNLSLVENKERIGKLYLEFLGDKKIKNSNMIPLNLISKFEKNKGYCSIYQCLKNNERNDNNKNRNNIFK